MRFQAQKAETNTKDYLEFRRLDSFFTDAHSRVYIPVKDQDAALKRYEQLHNVFYAR